MTQTHARRTARTIVEMGTYNLNMAATWVPLVVDAVLRGDFECARECAVEVQCCLDIAASCYAQAETLLFGLPEDIASELDCLDVWYPAKEDT